MKQVRRFLSRGVLVPLALFALMVASSVPASAAPLNDTADVSISLGPLSMNW